MDAARMALRLGAESVRVAYRRTRPEMPADPVEVREATDEGVRFAYLRAPLAIEGEVRVLSIRCAAMELGSPDASGRRRPVRTALTETFETDHVIVAVGQRLDDEGIAVVDGVDLVRDGRIAVNHLGATVHPRVFAGGDAVTGPKTIVEAIAAGKRAAYAMDLALSNDPERVIREPIRRETHPAEPRYRPRGLRAEPMVVPGHRDNIEQTHDFDECEKTYTDAEARAEARRCLACGLCASCRNCLDNFGCPAFFEEEGRVYIDPALCDGCGVCVQVCPNGAIGLAEAHA
jgi:NADPH-dependent glutamate synthase beta subunit-like oxidoreductase